MQLLQNKLLEKLDRGCSVFKKKTLNNPRSRMNNCFRIIFYSDSARATGMRMPLLVLRVCEAIVIALLE